LTEELRSGAEGSRQIQVTVFDTHAAADQDEFLAKFDDVRYAISYPEGVGYT
jgi:hypothetical protein